MENKLMSMVDFVLTDKYTEKGHKNYANFLKQPLEIWMFVPCKLVDGVWAVLEEPHRYIDFLRLSKSRKEGFTKWFDKCKEYQQAKDRVLFKGFSQGIYPLEKHIVHEKGWGIHMMNLGKIKIEEYANERYNLELTPTALKQIGL